MLGHGQASLRGGHRRATADLAGHGGGNQGWHDRASAARGEKEESCPILSSPPSMCAYVTTHKAVFEGIHAGGACMQAENLEWRAAEGGPRQQIFSRIVLREDRQIPSVTRKPRVSSPLLWQGFAHIKLSTSRRSD